MTDIIEQAREALAFSDSLISSDELYDLAPDLARIAIAAEELAKAVEHERNMPFQGFGVQMEASDAVDAALAAFKAAKETDQ